MYMSSFDPMQQSIMINALYKAVKELGGEFEFTYTEERYFDRFAGVSFGRFLKNHTEISDEAYAKLEMVFDDPHRRITAEQAEILGGHIGHKTSKAVLRFIKGNCPEVMDHPSFWTKYTEFATGVSPFSKKRKIKMVVQHDNFGCGSFKFEGAGFGVSFNKH